MKFRWRRGSPWNAAYRDIRQQRHTFIIVAGAAEFAFAGNRCSIQMAMLFAGVATLFQTIGFGPVNARLPVMGHQLCLLPIMIGIVKSSGMAALMGSVVVAGLFHAALGTIIGRIRHWFPPLSSEW